MSDRGEKPRHLARSADSYAFEKMWLELPRSGPLPLRRAFHPRLAKSFLRHVILVQAPSLGDPTLRIRLVGDGLRQQISGNIVGQDYLDFMEEEDRRALALELVRAMFERPCGQWWISPVQYERDFAQFWEVTAFPLGACERGPAAVLGLVRPFDALINRQRGKGRAVRIDAAVRFEAIDVSVEPGTS